MKPKTLEQFKIFVANEFRRVMKIQKVTQAELARRLGVNRCRVTQILSGRENLTVSQMVKIASALDCELEINFMPNFSITSPDGKFEIYETSHDFQIKNLTTGGCKSLGNGVGMYWEEDCSNPLDVGTPRFYQALEQEVKLYYKNYFEAYFGNS